jgi:hypothetical protein
MILELNSKTTNKWKDVLLKTSLPLEQLVAETLVENDFYVHGEFSYVRRTEKAIDAEFSADLYASMLLPRKAKDDYWASLNLLVECKYNYPGVRWVFTPHLSDITIGVITRFDDLTNKEIPNTEAQFKLDSELPYCVRGIELHESDANLQSIPHGLSQLRFAVPHLVARICSMQAFTGHTEDLHIEFLCSLLVTTASLHVLKPGLKLETFQNASDLAEVAAQIDALVVYQSAGPELSKYARGVVQDFRARDDGIAERLKTRSEVLKNLGRKYWEIIDEEWLEQQFEHAAERVLVVNFRSLERMLKRIYKPIKAFGKSVKDVAAVHFDVQAGRGIMRAPSAVES